MKYHDWLTHEQFHCCITFKSRMGELSNCAYRVLVLGQSTEEVALGSSVTKASIEQRCRVIWKKHLTLKRAYGESK